MEASTEGARAKKGIKRHRVLDSEDELPNTKAETSSEGEHNNEHPATLTEMQARIEASEPGQENS